MPTPPRHHVIDKLNALARGHDFVERVILYGSRARGDNRERSDFDVAVDCPGASQAEWARFRSEVEELPTLYAIDCLRLEEAAPRLRAEIDRDGVVLYQRAEVPA